jgi:hypothetical protein
LKDETDLTRVYDWIIDFKLPENNKNWVYVPPPAPKLVFDFIEPKVYDQRITGKAFSMDHFGRVELQFSTDMVN